MTIEFNAFQNCVSLHEIDFSKCDDVVITNILQKDNLPSDYQIIVKNSIYKKQVEKEFCLVKSHIIKKSNKIQQNINNLNNSCILKSIDLLNKTYISDEINLIIQSICNNLKIKYNISKELIDNYYKLKEQKYESERI